MTTRGIVLASNTDASNSDDMKEFFYECINGIIELVCGQIGQIEDVGRSVKVYFMLSPLRVPHLT